MPEPCKAWNDESVPPFAPLLGRLRYYRRLPGETVAYTLTLDRTRQETPTADAVFTPDGSERLHEVDASGLERWGLGAFDESSECFLFLFALEYFFFKCFGCLLVYGWFCLFQETD